MATEVLLRNPTTGDEKSAYEGYSWTTLCFGAFPTLLRGDIKLGLGILPAVVVLSFAALAAGLPSWVASGTVGGIWGFFYNEIHFDRLRNEGYEVATVPPPAPG